MTKMSREETGINYRILYRKDIYWPFGSHLTQCLFSKIYADMKGLLFLYSKNRHCIYNEGGGDISFLLPNMSDDIPLSLNDLIFNKFSDWRPNGHDGAIIIEANGDEIISHKHVGRGGPFFQQHYKEEIEYMWTSGWHKYKPSNFESLQGYHSSIMRKMSKPSSFVDKFLCQNHFFKKMSSISGKYISFHMRWTDKVEGSHAESEFYGAETYLKLAVKARRGSGINKIVICADNIEAINEVEEINSKRNMKFEILYDESEVLPKNQWRESFFQKSIRGEVNENQYLFDFLNGFKIFNILKDSYCIIGNYDSNMCMAPVIFRNNQLDVSVSGRTKGRTLDPDHELSDFVKKQRN